MAAGYIYNLDPVVEQEERYKVDTGVRRIGAFKLVTTGLTAGSILPSFTPICADLVAKTATVVRNVTVYEDAAADATSLKIKKGTLPYVGMILGTGSKGATISAIDTSNASYDLLTISAFTVIVKAGQVLFDATAAGGTTQKLLANSALYGRAKVGTDDLVTLLRHAAEIEPSKLVMPFSDKDKANMPHFEFNE